MLCIQQEKVSRFYYFSPYFELFCTIFIFPYKLQKITLLRNACWRLFPKELGAPVILRMKNHFIWSLPDTSTDEILIKQETALSVTPPFVRRSSHPTFLLQVTRASEVQSDPRLAASPFNFALAAAPRALKLQREAAELRAWERDRKWTTSGFDRSTINH